MKILLEAGADVEHQNENGHTPLMEAASCGHVGMFYIYICSDFFWSFFVFPSILMMNLHIYVYMYMYVYVH